MNMNHIQWHSCLLTYFIFLVLLTQSQIIHVPKNIQQFISHLFIKQCQLNIQQFISHLFLELNQLNIQQFTSHLFFRHCQLHIHFSPVTYNTYIVNSTSNNSFLTCFWYCLASFSLLFVYAMRPDRNSFTPFGLNPSPFDNHRGPSTGVEPFCKQSSSTGAKTRKIRVT